MKLVRMACCVEARVMFSPTVGTGLAQAPALLIGVDVVATVEVVGKVFFARQIRAPWHHAAGAVVQCARHTPAGGVGGGLHLRVSGGRALQGERYERGEAPGVVRRPHHLPAPVLQVDLDDRHAKRRLRLPHLFRRSRFSRRQRAAGHRRCTCGSSQAGRGCLRQAGSTRCRRGACPSARPDRLRCLLRHRTRRRWLQRRSLREW